MPHGPILRTLSSDSEVFPSNNSTKSTQSATNDDSSHPLEKSIRDVSGAKYIEGSVGMQRTGKMRVIAPLRQGVLVINLHDGGCLTFYKIKSTNARAAKHFRCLDENYRSQYGENGQNGFGSQSSQNGHNGRHTYNGSGSDYSSLPSNLEGGSRNTKLSISSKSFPKMNMRRSSDLGSIYHNEKISVFVSEDDFFEHPDLPMPYLRIPGSVPWKFKRTKSNFLKNGFQIIVPPLPDGTPDHRVFTLKYKDQLKNMIRKSEKNEGFPNDDIFETSSLNGKNGNDGGTDFLFDDETNFISTNGSKSASSPQIFTFHCENEKEIAIYMMTVQMLGRVCVEDGGGLRSIISKTKHSRIRTVETMEIAARTQLLDKRPSVRCLFDDSRKSSVGQEEYKCVPLYCYPHRWMTKDELAVELVRSSKNPKDFRTGSPEEIGQLHIEVLQCHGLPKMDTYSLTDAMCYFVCEGNAFVTDVIPDNLNPAWLPLSRRACILPLKNAYSQCYIGVFDYDGENEMDDFIGRVVLDVPRLQSGITYDITLPLRNKSRVYQRKKLGSIRIRCQLNWARGERAALLSYLPEKPADVAKRLKGPQNTVTVTCPDSKSFQSVVLTVYGKDMPGKYTAEIKIAAQREMTMLNKIVMYLAKKTIKDIAKWKNPLLSGYIFCWWMHFVIDNSVQHVPSFIMTLIFILLLRNYVKFNVNSAVGSLYGHRTIGDMIRILLFDRDDSKVNLSDVRRKNNRSIGERLLLKLFGISDKGSNPKDSWNKEDHSEFPFSVGFAYPKMSVLDGVGKKSAANKKFAASIPQAPSESDNILRFDTDEDESSAGHDSFHEEDDYSDGEDADDADDDVDGKGILNSSLMGMQRKLSTDLGKVATPLIGAAGTLKGATSSIASRTMMKSQKNSSKAVEAVVDKSIPINLGTNERLVTIPDQNVKTKLRSTKTIQDQINMWHGRAQKANLHLFDDRVFFAEDREETEKLLKFNNARNPIVRRLAPFIAGGLKILDIELSAFRAVFNIFMWNDPMLSFWAMMFVLCLTLVFFVFPWRKFFFIVGLAGLGPQNWFLARWHESKIHAKTRDVPFADNGSLGQSSNKPIKSQQSESEISKSPLLLRNNTQMSVGKVREVIVPSVPFRYNRFYDWPPDPAVTTMKTSEEKGNIRNLRRNSLLESSVTDTVHRRRSLSLHDHKFSPMQRQSSI